MFSERYVQELMFGRADKVSRNNGCRGESLVVALVELGKR